MFLGLIIWSIVHAAGIAEDLAAESLVAGPPAMRWAIARDAGPTGVIGASNLILVGPGGTRGGALEAYAMTVRPHESLQHRDPEAYSRQLAVHEQDAARAALMHAFNGQLVALLNEADALGQDAGYARGYQVGFADGAATSGMRGPADFNADGVINTQDFFDFLTAFYAAGGR